MSAIYEDLYSSALARKQELKEAIRRADMRDSLIPTCNVPLNRGFYIIDKATKDSLKDMREYYRRAGR